MILLISYMTGVFWIWNSYEDSQEKDNIAAEWNPWRTQSNRVTDHSYQSVQFGNDEGATVDTFETEGMLESFLLHHGWYFISFSMNIFIVLFWSCLSSS